MLVLTIALLGAASQPLAKPACQSDALQPVGGKPGARVHKLGTEPPARQIYTVLRSENGCSRPVPVNDRVIGTVPQRR